MDADNFQQEFAHANELLENSRFEDALESASIALLSAVTTDEIFKAKVLLIKAHFNLNHFDEVCLVADELHGVISDERVAIMIGLSCFASTTKYNRHRTIKVLTNSAESICRLCFDSDSEFSSLRNVAMDIVDARYGDALTRLSGMSMAVANWATIQENLTKNLLVEYISSFSKVPISQISQEFKLSEDEIVTLVARLILQNSRVSHYRIDVRMGEIHQQLKSTEQRLGHMNFERERLSGEITNELSLFNLRLLTATGRWVVGKDVST
jgi:hypothetical protein